MSNKAKATDVKEDGKPALVPKLRFPEFRGAEGWKAIPLNQLATRGKQKNRDEKIVRVLTNSAEFGVMDQRDYFDKDIATQGQLDGYFVVELGDYVYNPRISTTAPVGPISKNNIATGVMSPLYTVFKFKDRNNDFYAHYFKTTGWHAYMRQASSTGARHDRMAISSDDFVAMPMPVASPEEQQKIAECLSSVDELIAAQARKLDALKIHKQGLMQQLFPGAGETQPRLRFPEFQNAGEWEETRLGKMGELVSGLTYSPDDVREHGLLVLRSSNVQNGKIALLDCVYVDPCIKGANLSLPNDILICVRNGSTALIGKSALIPEGMPLCTHGAFMTVFRSQTPSFVFQLFQTSKYQKQVAGDLGATINSINGSQFLRYKFFVPKPPEQQRIPVGPFRRDGRRCAFQKPRPRSQIRSRLCLPPARFPLPERRRRDGHHLAPRRALPWRRGGTQLYRDRADCENGFDELKNQWGWGGFTTQDIERCQTSARSVALVYNGWSWYCRAAKPGVRMEAITSRALLLAGVGRAVKHAGQTTLYLTPMHAAKDKLIALIANIRAALSHVRAVAEQFPLTDRWKTFLDYVVAKITRPLPPWHRPDRLTMAG